MTIEMIHDVFLHCFVFVAGPAAPETWDTNLGK